MHARLYMKLREQKAAENHPEEHWQCLVPLSLDEQILEAAGRTLQHFAGCWVKANGCLAELRQIGDSPRLALHLVRRDGAEMHCRLGMVELHLPYERPS